MFHVFFAQNSCKDCFLQGFFHFLALVFCSFQNPCKNLATNPFARNLRFTKYFHGFREKSLKEFACKVFDPVLARLCKQMQEPVVARHCETLARFFASIVLEMCFSRFC